MRYLRILPFSILLFGTLNSLYHADSNEVVTQFMNKMVKAVQSSDRNSIAALFRDDFYFEDCNRNWGKSPAVRYLSGARLDFELHSSKYISTNVIEYSAAITVAGNKFEAVFLLDAKNGILRVFYGKIPHCARNLAVRVNLELME
uniref:NTF2-like domain-containing protein n=1 Tax=Caenorhabditis japonica TaxID=281687 RepID=A0A8R1EC23_CAEJA